MKREFSYSLSITSDQFEYSVLVDEDLKSNPKMGRITSIYTDNNFIWDNMDFFFNLTSNKEAKKFLKEDLKRKDKGWWKDLKNLLKEAKKRGLL